MWSAGPGQVWAVNDTFVLYSTNAGLGEPWEVSIGASVDMKRPLLSSLVGLPAGILPW